MAQVSRKLSNSLQGALAGGGDPATSPLYVFTPFLKLIVLAAAAGVAEVTFGATVWLVVFTIFMVSAMYRLVMRWVTDGSGGSGLSEEEFGPWAVKVNAAITVIEYTLTFLVSMAALVTLIADRIPLLNHYLAGVQYRAIVAVALSVFTGWLVNRGPKMAAWTFGPATGGVLLLLWAMMGSTLWKHLTGDPALSGVPVLPEFDIRAFSLAPTAPGAPTYLHYTLGGYSRILAVMTGIEVFANLVAAYEGDAETRARRAFGSLLIIMGTTAATMLIVGPAIFALSDPAIAEVSVFTQAMDQLLPPVMARFGTIVGVAVLLSASAASAQGLQNLALGLARRHYIPAVLGRRNAYGVADKPVWLEVGISCICFLLIGTSEETYLAIYAAGVFILLSMTGWAAAKRLVRHLRRTFDLSHALTLAGAVLAAALTTGATMIIFDERFREGAWIFLVFIPLLYAIFSHFRGELGAPSPAVERLGEIEEAALGGFGPGQFEPLPAATQPIAVSPQVEVWPEVPAPGEGWRRPAPSLSHLLLPLDGTPAAEAALPLALALARPGGGRVALISVLLPGETDRLTSERRAEYLHQLARRVAAEGVTADSYVRSGSPAAVISTVADELGVDGIVMCTEAHRRDGSELGRVVRPVLQQVHRPVVLLRCGPRAVPTGVGTAVELRRIVVALDGSEFAERILPYARWMARQIGSELVLVTVPEVPPAEQYGPLQDLVAALRTAAEEKATQYLENVVLQLREEGLNARGIVAGTGPARTILGLTALEKADMAMIATHGRGGLARLFMGSMAERVLAGAEFPVFLLPIRERGEPVPAAAEGSG